MALTERKIIGSINVLEDGQIAIREDTIIERDDVFISRSYHRHVVAPDISDHDYNNQDAKVKTVIDAIHTDKVKADYETWKAAQIKLREERP